MFILSNHYFKSILNFFKYSIIFLIIPPLVNYAALQREIQFLNNHGLPYDVGHGQRLFLSCKGKGTPTVVMESPIGFNSDFWLPLQLKLSDLTKVCVYDRAGLGMSERPLNIPVNQSDKEQVRAKVNRGQEFTIERMVEDLHRLISSSSTQEKPIMFISAEFGSLIARFYAQIYENDVSHLVLINPMVENLFDLDNKIWKHHWYEHVLPKWNSLAIGSVIGLNRVLLMLNLIEPQINLKNIPEDLTNRQKHLMCHPRHLFSLVDEFQNLNETFAQMKLIRSIKQFPQNISVNIFNGEKDSFSEIFESNDVLKKTYTDSQDSLKIFHPNANYKKSKNFNTNSMYENSNHLFDVCSELILKWRKNQKDEKRVVLETNKI